MKKMILNLALAATAVASVAANAATQGTACSGAKTAGPGTAVTADTTATNEFVLVTFTPQCSANTFVEWAQTATAMGVASASAKGRNYFSGSTNGGGVQPTGTKCPDTGCVDSGLATIAAQKAGSSS